MGRVSKDKELSYRNSKITDEQAREADSFWTHPRQVRWRIYFRQ